MQRSLRYQVSMSAVLPVLILALTGCGHSYVKTAEAFEKAYNEGDYVKAVDYMSATPRIWFDERDGPGTPWVLGRGVWRNWDEHFQGESTRVSGWDVEGNSVSADMLEINDYYRLTERDAATWRRTYYFDEEGFISGTLISASQQSSADDSRFNEFEAWARANRPDELEHLMPEGRVDPSEDRPQRFRALLNEWRVSVGLPRIE